MSVYKWNEGTQSLERRDDSLPYRSKWACFYCRKSFTRIRRSRNETVKCPDCERDAIDMGYLFEPPPKRDRNAWERMEVLGSHGFGYHKVSSKSFIRLFLTEGDTLTPKMIKTRIEKFLEEHPPRENIGDNQ